MTTTKIISREDSGGVELWQVPTVNAPKDSLASGLLTASKLEEIQKAAQQEGYQAGFKQGLAKGEAEIKAKVDRLVKIWNLQQAPLKSMDDAVQEQLVALAIAVARQIVRRELKTDPGQVVAAVRDAVGTLPIAVRNVRIHLHPEDAALVRSAIAGAESASEWKIVEDPALGRGDCKVVTDTSQVDATVERRIAAVAAALLGGERSGEQGT